MEECVRRLSDREHGRLLARIVGSDERDDYVGGFRKGISCRKKNLDELERRRRCLQFNIKRPNPLEYLADHGPPARELLLCRRALHFDCQAMANAGERAHTGPAQGRPRFGGKQRIARTVGLVGEQDRREPLGKDAQVFRRYVATAKYWQKWLLD